MASISIGVAVVNQEMVVFVFRSSDSVVKGARTES